MIRILKSFHRTHEYITHDDTSNNHIVLVDMGKWFDQCFEGSYAECLDYVRASQKCPADAVAELLAWLDGDEHALDNWPEQEESEHGPRRRIQAGRIQRHYCLR